MLISEVKQSISNWSEWAAKPDVQRYDIALLKIWIQFEKFLGDLFLTYATGNPSEAGYLPTLEISFRDEEQFNIFMRDGSKKYIEYLDKIEKLSSHIFNPNPFDIILLDAINKSAFEEMKALRNLIAHESGEAKRKVINLCFNGDVKKYKEPNDYLKSLEPESKVSYYSYYVAIITGIIDSLIIAPATV